MKYKTIINGTLTEQLSVADRGFNYCDGFFTTAKVENGEIQLWRHHKDRLLECQQRLGFSPLDIIALEQQAQSLVQNVETAVLKIIITRGNGGRGYAPPADETPTIVCRLSEFPQNYTMLGTKGLHLGVAKMQLAQQPLLAGLKTLNRLEQVLLKQEAQRTDYDDLIVLDTACHVTETSSANLLCYRSGLWFTPKLDQAGVKGVYLDALCDKLEINAVKMSLGELLSMDQVFCCNSLMGIVPVSSINQHEFSLDVANHLIRDKGLQL